MVEDGLFDLCDWCGFTPFIGAGIGYSGFSERVQIPLFDEIEEEFPCELEFAEIRWKSDDFAFQVIGGVSYCICPGFELNVQYRYFNADLEQHSVGVGFTYFM